MTSLQVTAAVLAAALIHGLLVRPVFLWYLERRAWLAARRERWLVRRAQIQLTRAFRDSDSFRLRTLGIKVES